MKKILAFLMALTLFLTMFATPVFASPFDDKEIEIDESGTPTNYNPINFVDDLSNVGDTVTGDNDSKGDKNISDYINPGSANPADVETATLNPDNGGTTKDTAQTFIDKSNSAQTFIDKHTGGSDNNSGNNPKDPFDDVVKDPLNADSGSKNTNTDNDNSQNVPADYNQKPEDFMGDAHTSTGEDGTVTATYPSGTVITQQKDGTWKGYDYAGRQVTLDADGTSHTTYSDGNVLTQNNDGSQTLQFKDGSRQEKNEDGSSTYVDKTGYRMDYDADGNSNGVIYFENGQSARITDENGDYVVGSFEITGPNGEKVTYNNTLDFNKVGDENYQGALTLTAEGNGKSSSVNYDIKNGEDGFSLDLDVHDSDGNSFTMSGNSSYDENGNQKFDMEIHQKGDDGSSGDITVSTYDDENGVTHTEFNGNTTGADGSTFTGTLKMTEDENGNGSTEFNMNGKEADGSHFEFNGNINGETGTGNIHFNSEEADGSNTKMDMEVKVNEDGTTSMEGNMSATDGKTGESSNIKMSGTFDENGKGNAEITISETDENGKTSDANIKIFEDGTGSLTTKDSDGNELNLTIDKDGNGNFVAKDENGNTINVLVDNDGNRSINTGDGKSWKWHENEDGTISNYEVTSPDGSYVKYDEDDGYEYNDTETGNYVKMDADKNVETCSINDKNSGLTYSFKDGTGVLTTKDGKKVAWTHDDDGNLVIASPNDGKYTVDENGNLYYNGEPLLVDGKWINVDTGFNFGETTTEAPTFMKQICGTYHLTGTCVSTVNQDRVETENKEFTVVISDAGNNCINMKREGSTGNGRDMTIDPETGVAFVDLSNEDGESTLQLTFTVSDDAVHLDYESVSSYTVGDYEYHDNGQDIEPWYCTDTTKLSGDKAD